MNEITISNINVAYFCCTVLLQVTGTEMCLQEISPEAIKVIASKLSSSTDCSAAAMFLDAVALHRPDDVLPYENEIIEAYNSTGIVIDPAGSVLVKIATSEVQVIAAID